MIVAFQLTIIGHVQGVGFRAFVMRQARRRGLRGWVRNRRDGNLEALLIGEDDAVAAVIEECRRGPVSAVVDRIDKAPAQDDGTPEFTDRATV